MNGIRDKIFFHLCFLLYHPVLANNNAGKRFFNFLNFLLFFSQFSFPCGVWPEFGTKIFLLFLGLFQPVLDRNNAGINFFIFLLFFLEFSYPGRVWTEFGTKFFFFSFSAYLSLFWLKIMPERCFLIFLLFFSIFFGIFLPGSNMNGIWE